MSANEGSADPPSRENGAAGFGGETPRARMRRRKGRWIMARLVQQFLTPALVMLVCGVAGGAITYSTSDRGALASVSMGGVVDNVNNWTSLPGFEQQWSHLDRVPGTHNSSVMASAVFDTWVHSEFLELHSSNTAYYDSFGPTLCNAWARTDAHVNFTIDRDMRFFIQKHGPGLNGSNAFSLFEFTGPNGVVITDNGWDLFTGVLLPGDYHLRIVSDMLLPTGYGDEYAAQSYYFLLGSKRNVPTPGAAVLLAAGLIGLRRRS